MASLYNNIHSFSFSDFISAVKEEEPVAVIKEIPFALPTGGALSDILQNSYLRSILNKVVEKQYIGQIEELLANSTEVSSTACPVVYQVLIDCCRKIKLSPVPRLVITDQLTGVNALTIGSDHISFIAISRLAVAQLSHGEIQFILGHECGHLIQNNLVCHTVRGLLNNIHGVAPIIGSLVSDLIAMPLNRWHRCAEITSDRAGLICCGDLLTAQRTLIGSETGFNPMTDEELNAYIKQCKKEQLTDAIRNYFELDATHPMIAKRLIALEYFYYSEYFQKKVIGKKKKSDQTGMIELNEHVTQLLK